jgi:hypothetical protein
MAELEAKDGDRLVVETGNPPRIYLRTMEHEAEQRRLEQAVLAAARAWYTAPTAEEPYTRGLMFSAIGALLTFEREAKP